MFYGHKCFIIDKSTFVFFIYVSGKISAVHIFKTKKGEISGQRAFSIEQLEALNAIQPH